MLVQEHMTVWGALQSEIINCEKCPRLVRFRRKIAREKKKQFRNFEYWGRPVPSNGSLDAKLVIIGLAPAGHGGNRTGRMFTGDGSAKFLFKHLYSAGFANQPNSDQKGDGQKLIDCYITAVAHCVPPDNRLNTEEIRNCSEYLAREFVLLQNPKAILALGRVAFDSVIHLAQSKLGVRGRIEFKHGKKYKLSRDFPIVFASYHPSPRNTQTGKLTSKMFSKVLSEIRQTISS
jgi:uracil-DNA glycosylase family 4